jgi:indole-3-glycerol phosphate synthase
VSTTDRSDVLETIVGRTRIRLHERRQQVSVDELMRTAVSRQAGVPRFREALCADGPFRVIAECKRRSPSRGVLRADYDPVEIASAYVEAGAVAVSVLTEPEFFDGSLDHLRAVRAAVAAPLLRKDFNVSDYQLVEARAAGADAVLLIVAALDESALATLLRQAEALDLDALVEVHSLEEARIALRAGARIIGVNNRNLRTLSVDTAVSTAVVAEIPDDVVAVSESGLRTTDDLRRLSDIGYDAFLVGERLVTQPRPGLALRDLITGRTGDDTPSGVPRC